MPEGTEAVSERRECAAERGLAWMPKPQFQPSVAPHSRGHPGEVTQPFWAWVFSFQNETPKQILSSSKFGVSVAVYLHIAVSALRGLGCLQLPCSRARGLSGCRARESLAAEPGLSCPVAHAKLVSRPGIKPVSPAGEGGFPTSGPWGKSLLLSSLQIGSLSTFVSILKFKKYELSSEIYLSKMKVV